MRQDQVQIRERRLGISSEGAFRVTDMDNVGFRKFIRLCRESGFFMASLDNKLPK